MTRRRRQRRPWTLAPNSHQTQSAPAADRSYRVPPPPPTPVAAEKYLSELALILENRGWKTFSQFDVSPNFLRVTDQRVPHIGETVMLVQAASVSSVQQVPWFKSSTGVIFAPCTDPQGAAEAIRVLLAPWVAMVLEKRTAPHRPPR